MPTLQFTSDLAADAETVWRHATSLAGINAELAPFLAIDGPAGLRTLSDLLARDAADPPISCTLRALGLVPVTWWTPTLTSLEARRFVEQSEMPALSHWAHDREVVPTERGCRVIDRLTYEARFPWPDLVVRASIEALFTHRHQRLATRFG